MSDTGKQEPTTKPEASEAKPETEHINLKVVGADNQDVFFKIKKTTRLEKLMQAYCDRTGRSMNSVRFLFDGQRLAPNNTPAEPYLSVAGPNSEILYTPENCLEKAKDGDLVDVHYSGRLYSTKKVFDSSYERKEPISFRLGRGMVIEGWDIGINGMCVGMKKKLIIPPELGYGERGFPPVIPGNAVLEFDVEL
ncbi:Peptidyl-prolyl cis-trans isomerase FPR2, partial [Zancudomyces culisetae]